MPGYVIERFACIIESSPKRSFQSARIISVNIPRSSGNLIKSTSLTPGKANSFIDPSRGT